MHLDSHKKKLERSVKSVLTHRHGSYSDPLSAASSLCQATSGRSSLGNLLWYVAIAFTSSFRFIALTPVLEPAEAVRLSGSLR